MKRNRAIQRCGTDRAIKVCGLAAILIALLGASCPVTVLQPLPTPEPGITDVVMQNFGFVPDVVSIQQGERVRWTNRDVFTNHTVTSGNPGDADAGSLFDSGMVATNQTFVFQFNNVGDFVYFCRVHPTIMFNAHVIVRPQ